MPLSDYFFIFGRDPSLGDPNPANVSEWIEGEAWLAVEPRRALWLITGPPSYLD